MKIRLCVFIIIQPNEPNPIYFLITIYLHIRLFSSLSLASDR